MADQLVQATTVAGRRDHRPSTDIVTSLSTRCESVELRGTAETVCTGQAASRVIAAQPNSANIRPGGKCVSPYPLSSNRDDLSGRSLAGPQIVLNGGAVAVNATPPARGRAWTATAPPRKPASTSEGSGLALVGSSWGTTVRVETEGVGETRPLSCGVSHGTRTPVRGLDRATSRRPIAHLTCVAVKVSRHRRTP